MLNHRDSTEDTNYLQDWRQALNLAAHALNERFSNTKSVYALVGSGAYVLHGAEYENADQYPSDIDLSTDNMVGAKAAILALNGVDGIKVEESAESTINVNKFIITLGNNKQIHMDLTDINEFYGNKLEIVKKENIAVASFIDTLKSNIKRPERRPKDIALFKSLVKMNEKELRALRKDDVSSLPDEVDEELDNLKLNIKSIRKSGLFAQTVLPSIDKKPEDSDVSKLKQALHINHDYKNDDALELLPEIRQTNVTGKPSVFKRIAEFFNRNPLLRDVLIGLAVSALAIGLAVGIVASCGAVAAAGVGGAALAGAAASMIAMVTAFGSVGGTVGAFCGIAAGITILTAMAGVLARTFFPRAVPVQQYDIFIPADTAQDKVIDDKRDSRVLTDFTPKNSALGNHSQFKVDDSSHDEREPISLIKTPSSPFI